MFLQFFFAFTIFACSVFAKTKCPSGSVNFKSKCYQFNPQQKSFLAAKRSCAILGGHLASIPDEETNHFLSQESLKQFDVTNAEEVDEADAWIGGELLENSNHWDWDDNMKFEYSNFKIYNFRPEYAFLALDYVNEKWNAYNVETPLRRKPFICVYLTSSSVPSAPPTPGCPKGSNQSITDKNSCYFFKNEYTNFMDADQQCREFGGNLASIHSAFENVFLTGAARKAFLEGSGSDFWIGANNLATPGTWSWMDETPFDFTNSENGELETTSNSNCAALSLAHSQWISSDCLSDKPFVCLVKIGVPIEPQPPPPPPTPSTPIQKADICPYSWTYYNGTESCFKVFDNANWEDGEAHCNAENANLASFHSKDEALFVANFAYNGGNGCNRFDQAWIGLRSVPYVVDWKWTDGTPFDYYSWALGEPDDAGRQNCGFFQFSSCPGGIVANAGDFENTFCTEVLAKFICKKPARKLT